MRNLKRALSLTLASVMFLGMMVVGSGAVGYDDVDESNNVEAIEVLQEIEVMVGDERGFGPDRPVNRAEMAVVMGKLLNLDYNYYSAACPFNDVYDWARGYVGACYANKILSGRGDGIYDPGSSVTAVEAAMMLMRALGYFQYSNDVADGWILATVTQGNKIGIFDGVDANADSAMTRDQVAQMVLNALQCAVVEPDGNTTTFLNPDGTVLATTGKVNYVSVTSNKPFASAISKTQATSIGSTNDGWIVELGERLYNGDLKLYGYTDDEFMRPSRTWEYDGKEIGTYMKKENIRETYTTAVSKRDLYDKLGRTILQEYDFAYYVDGVLIEDTAANILSRQTNDYGQTGRGVLTQVFVDVEAETIDITSINTWLAKAANDYSKTTESVSLNVYGSITESGTSPNITYKTDSYTKTVSLTDVPAIEDVKQDQYVLVNVSGKDYTSHTPKTLTGYDVVAISDPEIMSDTTLTKFSKGSSSDINSDGNRALFKSVVTGGTEYKTSQKTYYNDDVLDLYDDDRLVNKTYNIYLDKYGYPIGIDLFEGESNYVFITGFDPSGSWISYGNANANAIFTDGTQSVIKVDTKATNKNIEKVEGTADGAYFEQWDGSMSAEKYALNRWYTYTVDSNNVYTLHPATRMITTEVATDVGAPTGYPSGLTIKTNSVRIDENASDTIRTAAAGTTPAVYWNGAAQGKTGTRVYGNDNSVYLVVEPDDTELVDKSEAPTRKVITEVSGVYTGVQNVEIEVTTTTNGNAIPGTALYDSIYTVYDKNNYIIASVVIGEAKGNNANYAYILTAAKSEERLSDGTTIWEFEAVVDGKVVTLKTNSKFSSVISSLEPGHVQELRYNGDYVTGVKTPAKTTQYWGYDEAVNASQRIDKEEIYDIGHDWTTVVAGSKSECGLSDAKHESSDSAGNPYVTKRGHLTYSDVTVGTEIRRLYEASDLKMIGNTMYFQPDTKTFGGTTYAKDSGLAIVNGAPAVVIHKVDGDTKKIECSSVAQAIAELGDPEVTTTAKEFAGRIVAVLNDQGAAKWVVFISDTEVTTKGEILTGNNCSIKVRKILNVGNGITDELEPELRTVSTTALTSGYWTITAPTVTGYTAITASKTVTYVKGVREYEVSFTYTKDGASTSQDQVKAVVNYHLTNTSGTTVLTKVIDVTLDGGVAILNDADAAIKDPAAAENWKVTSTAQQVVTAAGQKIDVVVERAKAKLTIPTGWKYEWAADSSLGITAQAQTAYTTAAVDVPVGASVVIEVAEASDPGYYKEGNEYKANGEKFTGFAMPAAGKTITNTDVYKKVAAAVTVTAAAVTTELGTNTVSASVGAADVYVKVGDAVTVTFAMGGTAVNVTDEITAVLGGTTTGLTSANFANATTLIADGTQALATGTDTVTVEAGAAKNITLTYTLATA